MVEATDSLAGESLKGTGATLSRSDRLKAHLALMAKKSLNASLRFTRAALFLRPKGSENPRRVVVHLVGNVGDIVVAVPALIALRERYPDSVLTLVTSAGGRDKRLAGAVDLLGGAPFLDRIEAYATEDIRSPGGVVRMLKRLRRLRPDLMVMLPPCDIPFLSVLRNLFFARLAGARFVTGYEHINMKLFPLAQARSLGALPSEISRNLAHLRELGINGAEIRFDFGALKEDEKSRIESIVEESRPFVAICPGGKQVGHRWSPARFATVARRIKSDYGLSLIAVGSASERALCSEVLEAAGGGLNLAGEVSIRGTAELLSHALCLVTNDTGPMHLAAALKTPVVAVFGTRDFAGRWLPHGDGHEVFRAVLNCEQCLFAPIESDHCVKKISVEEVYQGVERVLGRLNHKKLPAGAAQMESRVDERGRIGTLSR